MGKKWRAMHEKGVNLSTVTNFQFEFRFFFHKVTRRFPNDDGCDNSCSAASCNSHTISRYCFFSNTNINANSIVDFIMFYLCRSIFRIEASFFNGYSMKIPPRTKIEKVTSTRSDWLLDSIGNPLHIKCSSIGKFLILKSSLTFCGDTIKTLNVMRLHRP